MVSKAILKVYSPNTAEEYSFHAGWWYTAYKLTICHAIGLVFLLFVGLCIHKEVGVMFRIGLTCTA